MKYVRIVFTSQKKMGTVENMHHVGVIADRGQVLRKNIGAVSLKRYLRKTSISLNFDY